MITRPAFAARLSRREWALVALGLAVWIALGVGGVWFARRLTEPKASCSKPGDVPTSQATGSTSPGASFKVLTGEGACK